MTHIILEKKLKNESPVTESLGLPEIKRRTRNENILNPEPHRLIVSRYSEILSTW